MITNIRINKVEAERASDDFVGNMKFNINFDDVKANGDNVDVHFTFLTQYEGGNSSTAKEVGNLKIVGVISSKEEKKEIEEIKSAWDKNKTLPTGFAENVINVLNFECGAKGTLLAYAMAFPAPLPLSRAKLQDKSENPAA